MDEGQKQNKVIETYAEDMAGVIESDQGGLIKKIIHEQELRDAEKNKASPQSKQNKFYMLAGSMMVVCAAALIIFFILKKENPPVPVENQFSPLIFNDKSFFIETSELSKEKIVESVLTEARDTKVKEGGVEGVYFTKNKRLIKLSEFLATTKMSWRPGTDAFVSENFLLGLFNQKTETGLVQRDIFILLKTRSFPDIFPSLKTWEGKMFSDLHGFFGVPINSGTSYLLTKNFDDAVVENKNARILYDKDGSVVMMYVFADDTSVVITDKSEAVREVMLRLSGSQLKK